MTGVGAPPAPARTRATWKRIPPRALRTAAVAAAMAYVGVFCWAMATQGYNTWASMVILPALAVITYGVARRAGRRSRDPALATLLMTAFALKMAATLVRYVVAFGVYDGRADATGYHYAGAFLAQQLRRGDFTLDLGGSLVGTQFIDLLTGIVYAVVGSTKLGGFFVFSWLGFWGLWLFYKAFRTAFPGLPGRRYSLVVFLMPSLLFWPSSIGKESWMLLGLGMGALGAAQLLRGQRGGLVRLALGLGACMLVRPHMALVTLVATGIAYAVKRQPRSTLPGARRLAGLAILVAGGLVVVANVETFFGVDQLSSGSVGNILESTQDRTSAGRSSFESGSPSLSRLPNGMVTILFRPFPTEARNAQALIASLEGVALAAMLVLALRRARQLPHLLREEPYAVFCLAYSGMFFFAFSSFSNFGIVSRQRVQLFPVLFALLVALYERRAAGDGESPAPPQVEGHAEAEPWPSVFASPGARVLTTVGAVVLMVVAIVVVGLGRGLQAPPRLVPGPPAAQAGVSGPG